MCTSHTLLQKIQAELKLNLSPETIQVIEEYLATHPDISYEQLKLNILKVLRSSLN